MRLRLAFANSESDGHKQFESSGVIDVVVGRVSTGTQSMSNTAAYESVNLTHVTYSVAKINQATMIAHIRKNPFVCFVALTNINNKLDAGM